VFRRPTAVEPPERPTLYVAAETLNVRATPSTEGAVLQKLRMGFAIAPKQRADEWIGFVMKDGSTGWLRMDFLSATKPVVVAAERQQEPLNLM
jgi:SH3-like domain-containing protein